MQLTQPGQGPGCFDADRRTLVALGFLVVQHTTAQRRRDADHAIEPIVADERAPLLGQVLFVLGGTTLLAAL